MVVRTLVTSLLGPDTYACHGFNALPLGGTFSLSFLLCPAAHFIVCVCQRCPCILISLQTSGPDDVDGIHKNELKQIDNIHMLLMSSMSVDSKDVNFRAVLALKLSKKNKKRLVFIAESLSVIPACANKSVTKVQLAEALVTWVCLYFLDTSPVLIFFLEETIFFFCC